MSLRFGPGQVSIGRVPLLSLDELTGRYGVRVLPALCLEARPPLPMNLDLSTQPQVGIPGEDCVDRRLTGLSDYRAEGLAGRRVLC